MGFVAADLEGGCCGLELFSSDVELDPLLSNLTRCLQRRRVVRHCVVLSTVADRN
ncbi:hypothetical protein HPP92_012246 [Vanilla planifolia]|uniref:Uncharacterized protein n=1 Tax=Vanilla planifolia TaxID=51239 RepID=A0A835V3L0_VANPL|nr:hypothetical protein HPP92_012246 [Vanilla planifolia]